MIFASQYSLNSFPVGATQRGEGFPSPMWTLADAKTLPRADYPRASAIFPVNKLTGTIRTLAGQPTIPLIVVAGTNFLASGPNPANALQYSADGIAWSVVSIGTITPAGIAVTPTRIVISSFTSVNPLVSANLSPASAWSSTSNGPANVPAGNSMSRVFYAGGAINKTFGMTGGSLRSLDEGSMTWVDRTSSASNTTSRQAGCFTGTRAMFVIAGSAVLDFTTDGANYTQGALLEATSSGQGNCASDGNGKVIVSGSPTGLQFSADHGATFKFVYIPGIPASDQWRVQRLDDRWVVPTVYGLAFSLNGENWFLERQVVQAGVTATAVARKAGVIAQITASTVAYTMVEDATKFSIHAFQDFYPNALGQFVASAPIYMKVK